MKVFLLVCLAAAVYAEPEADPLMVYNQGLLHHQPLMYNTHLASPLYNSHVASPLLGAVANQVVYKAANPVVYNAAPVYQYAAPMAVAQRATVHQTPKLVGPGGEVDAKTAVAGDLTSYTVYHKEKREAESEADPALLLKSAYAGVPLVNSGVYNTGLYRPAVYSTGLPQHSVYNTGLLQHSAYNTAGFTTPYHTYGGLRVVKREAEAESEADPAFLYRSAYTAGVPVAYNSAVYRPSVYSSVARPVVRSPYYSNVGYNYNGWY